MTDDTFRHPFRLGAGRCQVRVFRTARCVGLTTVIFRTVVVTNPPLDTLRLANTVQHAHQIDPDRLIWINYYPAYRRLWIFPLPEQFVRLHLVWDGDAYVAATREPISRTTALDLTGTDSL